MSYNTWDWEPSDETPDTEWPAAPMAEQLPQEAIDALKQLGDVRYEGGITKLYVDLGEDAEERAAEDEYFELATCVCGFPLCWRCGGCPADGDCECI